MTATIHKWTLKQWQRHSTLHSILSPLSGIFYLITQVRRYWLSAQAHKTRVPLIIVGNISAGGNGKTPFVIALSLYLKNQGYQVGIISRGYGRRYPKSTLCVDHEMPAECIGDEVALIWKKTKIPVVISPCRKIACERLEARDCDVIISDDGLQDYKLVRQMEIIVTSSGNLGNRMLHPLGPLRETLSRQNEADFIIEQSQSASENSITMRYEIESIRHHRTGELLDHSNWPIDQHIIAISAIGNPGRFKQLLNHAGFRVKAIELPDHASIREEDLAPYRNETILITEKDAIKLARDISTDCYVVNIKPNFNQEIMERIHKKLKLIQKNQSVSHNP